MPALALEGATEPAGGPPRVAAVLRYADLPLLVCALIIFVAAELPMLGFAIAAGAWLGTRLLQHLAERNAAFRLAAGDRRAALGFVAAARMARVWIIALAVLLAGVVEREAGLAAALLSAALFTTYFSGGMLAKMFDPEAPPSPPASREASR